jgi:hypothetical protein
LSLQISNTELSTLAVAKQLLIFGLSKAETQKKKGVTGKRKCLTIKFCHAPSCPQSERLPTSPINVMHAFLLHLLHQNMQYVLLLLYLLQVTFVCRIYRMSETKHRSLAMLATTIFALESSRLLILSICLLSLYYKIIKSVSQNNLKARRTVYALQSCQIPSQPFLDTFSASAQCLLRQLRIIPSVQGLPSMFMKPTNLSIFSRSSAMRWTRLGKRISSFVPSYAISRNKAHTIADLTPQFRKFRIASYPACENRILDFTIHISMQG